MRMSDIVAAMDLTVFPLIGLVLFGSVFVLVFFRAMFTSKAACQRWSDIPLEDAPLVDSASNTAPASAAGQEGC